MQLRIIAPTSQQLQEQDAVFQLKLRLFIASCRWRSDRSCLSFVYDQFYSV